MSLAPHPQGAEWQEGQHRGIRQGSYAPEQAEDYPVAPLARLFQPFVQALRTAAKSPWVEVDLARINPVGAIMDADPATVIGVLKEMKAAGKAVVGMKILGQGALRNRQDEGIKFALSNGVLDAFTIGAESKPEQEDLIRRIAAA